MKRIAGRGDARGPARGIPRIDPALRERCVAGVARLPKRYRQLQRPAAYPVRYSKRLHGLLDEIRRRVKRSAVK